MSGLSTDPFVLAALRELGIFARPIPGHTYDPGQPRGWAPEPGFMGDENSGWAPDDGPRGWAPDP